MAKPLIPENYEQWYHCITTICQQPMTLVYIDERLKALNNPDDDMTQKFIELYGNQQRYKTLKWFVKTKIALLSR